MSVEAEELNGKFALVQMLAKDLSKGGLELPSFPDIVVRIRKALADENGNLEYHKLTELAPEFRTEVMHYVMSRL